MNRLLPIAMATILLASGAVFFIAQTRPADMDARSMSPPDRATAANGAPMANVRVPSQLSDNAQIGKRGFDAKCASCHGPDAAGQNGVAPPLVHKIYEPNHHGDIAFQLAARNGVRSHHWKFGNMPPVEGLTDADVAFITLYVRELQRENGIN